MRTNMEAEFGIHRGIGCTRTDDTGVNHTIAVLLHVALQRAETERAFNIRIDGQPLFSNLGLQVDMRRGRKADVLGLG